MRIRALEIHRSKTQLRVNIVPARASAGDERIFERIFSAMVRLVKRRISASKPNSGAFTGKSSALVLVPSKSNANAVCRAAVAGDMAWDP